MLFACCSNSFYTCIWWPTLRRPMYRVSNCPHSCAHMFPPVSVKLIINCESVDYIVDTTSIFRVRVTYLLAVPLQIRVVAINSQVNLRHVTVPVNPSCVVLSLNTSLMSLIQHVRYCLSVQPLREIFAEYPDISTKIPMYCVRNVI